MDVAIYRVDDSHNVDQTRHPPGKIEMLLFNYFKAIAISKLKILHLSRLFQKTKKSLNISFPSRLARLSSKTPRSSMSSIYIIDITITLT
jgi:hypothetical protein